MSEINELIDEIKEDVRIDQLTKFWKNYANYIIGGFLALILSVALLVFWEHHKKQTNLKYATIYEDALRAADLKEVHKSNEILTSLEKGHGGFSILAAFKKSHLRNESFIESSKTYTTISNNKNFEPKFRELATILKAYENLDRSNVQEIRLEIEPIANGTSVWRYSAAEILGLIAMQENDLKKSVDIFKTLVEDQSTPSSLKGRALAYLQQIGAIN